MRNRTQDRFEFKRLSGMKSIPGVYRGAAASLLAALGLWALYAAGASARQEHGKSADGIRHIGHVIVIMQENRSFDSYFGTFP
jgi:phospholipase C